MEFVLHSLTADITSDSKVVITMQLNGTIYWCGLCWYAFCAWLLWQKCQSCTAHERCYPSWRQPKRHVFVTVHHNLKEIGAFMPIYWLAITGLNTVENGPPSEWNLLYTSWQQLHPSHIKLITIICQWLLHNCTQTWFFTLCTVDWWNTIHKKLSKQST